MPSFRRMVRAVLRTLIAFVAVGVLATSATATARSPAGADLLHSPAEDGRACAMADDPAATVVCGGEFLERYVDASFLVMAKDTCSRLLEELFAGNICVIGQEECGQMQPAAPLPWTTLAIFTAAPTTLPGSTPEAGSERVASLARAADERLPPSWSSRPPSPPPRA